MQLRTARGAVIVFVALVAIAAAPLYLLAGGMDPADAQGILLAIMFVPAVAAIVARLITGQKIRLGRPKVSGLLLAFVPALLMVALYFAGTPFGLLTFLGVGTGPADFTIAVLGAAVLAFGEELGWRGFMLPHLRREHGYLRANEITAVIWFLYHVPIIVMSPAAYGNPEIPLIANLLIFGTAVTGFSFYTGWIWERSHDVWTPSFMHGLWNHTVQGLLAASFVASAGWVMGEFGVLAVGAGATLLLLGIVMGRRYGTPLELG